jgi:hypothetical protein
VFSTFSAELQYCKILVDTLAITKTQEIWETCTEAFFLLFKDIYCTVYKMLCIAKNKQQTNTQINDLAASFTVHACRPTHVYLLTGPRFAIESKNIVHSRY